MTSAARQDYFLRRRTLLAGAVAAVGLGCAGHGVAAPALVDLKVVDRETGQPLRTWVHNGRRFVAGEPGSRYALRVTNHANVRVLVVMSVDGVNILTGETAGYAQSGYVFGPHESYDLTGWRKSVTEVAAFVFAPLPQSYAARTGRPADVGVIGIAAFREKAIPVPPPPVYVQEDRRSNTSGRMAPPPPVVEPAPSPAPPPPPPPAPMDLADSSRAAPASPARVQGGRASEEVVTASRAAPPEEKLGTAHGAREWSETRYVPFERATSYPQSIQQIEYNTYANLVAAGVIPATDAERHPRPFPVRPDGRGFVPDPPGGD